MKKRRIGRRKASLTLLAALTFMLLSQLLFVLAEGVRQREIVKVAKMNTDSVAESLMAEYCLPMWEEYHLLANDVGGSGSSIDLDYMKNYVITLTLSDFALESGMAGISRYNLLRTSMSSVTYDSYTLLTDHKGNAYIKLVGAYMKDNLAYEAAQKVFNNYEAIDNVESNSSYSGNLLTNALNSILGSSNKTNPAPSSKSVVTTGGSGSDDQALAEADAMSQEDRVYAEQSKQMLTDVGKAQSKDILDLVVPSNKTVSETSVEVSDFVSHRTLASGLNSENESISWYEKVLLQQYLLIYFDSFTSNENEDKTLSYELEYLIAGKSNDRDNLKSAVLGILAIREAANMVYLLGDPQKMAEAEAMATAIATACMIPEGAVIVKTGILAAWAFCESILDIRALLNGKRITLLKNSETWTSDITGMAEILSGTAEAEDCSGGLDYKSYLGVIMLGKTSETLAMRAMDLQESSIHKKDGYSTFQMDHCISQFSFTAEYCYEPMFYSFVYLISTGGGGMKISNQGAYSYLKKPGN